MKKEFLKREWKYLLLLILIFITTIYAPRDYLDVICILVFIVYSVVIYKFYGGYGGDYDSDRSIIYNIFNSIRFIF